MAKLDKNTALLLSEPIEAVYLDVIDRLILNIAKHLKSGTAIRTAGWEIERLQEMGQLTAENARIINEAVKEMPEKIRETLDEVSKMALADIDKAINEAIEKGLLEKAPADNVVGLLDDLAKQAIDQLNLVNTVMLQSSQSAYLQAVQGVVTWENQVLAGVEKNAVQSLMNTSATSVLTGAETRRVALKKAIQQLNKSGIYGFVDRAGRHWSPEAYVNMDIRTTVHTAAVQSIRTRQEDYGSDIFQVSTHAGARPLCYPWQGKFLSWGNQGGTFTDGNGRKQSYISVNETSYGEPAGLFGINCGHYPLPQIPGVTIPQSPDKMSKEENDRLYQESQTQRELEHRIRSAKREQAAFMTAGLQEEAEELSAVIRERQADMRRFIAETGRARRYDRESIKG